MSTLNNNNNEASCNDDFCYHRLELLEEVAGATNNQEVEEGQGAGTTPEEAPEEAPEEEEDVTVEPTSSMAYIVRVSALVPITHKTNIEIAQVAGWQCVVRKDEFHEGDLAVYLSLNCVPDAADANFDFFRATKAKYVKTAKIGGVVSQGLLGPLRWLTDRGHDVSEVRESEDVTAKMGVSKFVHAEEAAQYTAAPAAKKTTKPQSEGGLEEEGEEEDQDAKVVVVPKTDAERLQRDPKYWLNQAERCSELVVTRKEDGCSATFVWHNGAFSLRSRNRVIDAPDGASKHYFAAARSYDLESKMRALGRNLAVQGELCGPKINGNRHQLASGPTLSVYDVFDLDKGKYLPYDEVCAVCAQLELPQVPVLYRGPPPLFPGGLTKDSLIAFARGVTYGADVRGEGIVVNGSDDEDDAIEGVPGLRTHFKVISDLYLLKNDL